MNKDTNDKTEMDEDVRNLVYNYINVHFTRDCMRTNDYLEDVLKHVETYHGVHRDHLPV